LFPFAISLYSPELEGEFEGKEDILNGTDLGRVSRTIQFPPVLSAGLSREPWRISN
jgi:hypothetical protein